MPSSPAMSAMPVSWYPFSAKMRAAASRIASRRRSAREAPEAASSRLDTTGMIHHSGMTHHSGLGGRNEALDQAGGLLHGDDPPDRGAGGPSRWRRPPTSPRPDQ